MSQHPERPASPEERIHDHERIQAALRRAVQEALLDHKRTGDPVAIWRDGRVVWVPAEEIPVNAAANPDPSRRDH
jgi:hypothetical protein